MTEKEWLACDIPSDMLNSLRRGKHRKRFSQRKYLLFVVGRYRRDWDQFGDEAKAAITMTERYADGEVSKTAHDKSCESAYEITEPAFQLALYDDFSEANSDLAANVRDIFGNPFRPVDVDPAWLTPTVTALAEGIYQERAFDRMPVLADALEDAGCDNSDILTHCRQLGEHVRGCWVVDLLTGRK